MEEVKLSENHLTSAAAFVEGGIQEACDDACSICLESFCESEPSTVTGCKHEFHLQCILEWCQRSSQCPMCWQVISLKDPSSQELLDAVEQEREFRMNPPRNATIFRHPTLGDFELQHLPMSSTDAELEERIIQHLAAAAAMGRARHVARREGQRNRSSAQGRQHYLVFSAPPNAPSASPASSPPPPQRVGETSLRTVEEDSEHLNTSSPSAQADQFSASASGSSVLSGTSLNDRMSSTQSSPNSQNRAGPSELQSFSEALKSRFNAVSTRYKESFTKNTRSWRERFLSRNTSMSDIGSEVRREVNAGIATVSRMMDHLETRDNSETNSTSVPNNMESSSITDPGNHQTAATSGDDSGRESNTPASRAESSPSSNTQASCAASSASN